MTTEPQVAADGVAVNGDGAGAASAVADPAPTAEPEHAADVAASEPEAVRNAQLSQVRTRVSASIAWYEQHATWSRIGYRSHAASPGRRARNSPTCEMVDRGSSVIES